MDIDMESRVRPDVWKAIQAHYERKDYTECVRDTIYLLNELLRDLSGIEDKDGAKLVDSALLGANPSILLNKNETTTEKDFQQGIGFSVKGIMQSVRNPMSHEKTEYSQEDAESIILYVNFLLNQIDHSGGTTKIDNIMDLLLDDDFTDTKEYADLLLREVPGKKKYELALKLFNERENIPYNGVKLFIYQLVDSLSKAEKQDLYKTISRSLMKCKDDTSLRKYIYYFFEKTYEYLDKLVRLRIENLITKSIKSGKMEDILDRKQLEVKRKCNQEGSLGTWAHSYNRLFCNKEEFFNTLINHITAGNDEEEYIFYYFSLDLINRIEEMSQSQIAFLQRRLNSGDRFIYNWLWASIELDQNKNIIELFGNEFEKCKQIIEHEENKNKSIEEGAK